jgi:hypothetical protein
MEGKRCNAFLIGINPVPLFAEKLGFAPLNIISRSVMTRRAVAAGSLPVCRLSPGYWE